MPKRKQWKCDQVKLKFHKVEERDFKNLLAEFWEILLPSSSQFNLCPQPIAVDSKDRLSQLKRRTRR
jgi:hypothetical protein